MISIIIPTFNRGYTLSQVLDSYCGQKFVQELIVVDDGGSDNSADIVDEFSRKYPQIKTVYLRNEKRKGAPFSKRRGIEAANCEFILFGEDDNFLEENYTEVCLEKLKSLKADIVSGRNFYRNPQEHIVSAVNRFHLGNQDVPPFDFRLFIINIGARFQGDVELPFTNAIFLARRELMLSHDFDTFYRKGNGFREESDIQAKIYSCGGKIIMTNNTHSVHMHRSEVKSGGQRVGHFADFFWPIYYTSYFFKKYYNPIMARQGKQGNYLKGIITFTIYHIITNYPFLAWPIKILKKLRKNVFRVN
jgi:glycosyltransferase involved in cell wall biosynthesis